MLNIIRNAGDTPTGARCTINQHTHRLSHSVLGLIGRCTDYTLSNKEHNNV